MAQKKRGRHQSTDKTGRRTIARLRGVPGVKAVVIGRSYGGKSIGPEAVGDFKLQGEVQGGFKGILQTSKGIQELYISVSSGEKEATARAIRQLFPG